MVGVAAVGRGGLPGAADVTSRDIDWGSHIRMTSTC